MNGFRHNMEPNDILEIELGNVASIINFMAKNKMNHFRKPVRTTMIASFLL